MKVFAAALSLLSKSAWLFHRIGDKHLPTACDSDEIDVVDLTPETAGSMVVDQ